MKKKKITKSNDKKEINSEVLKMKSNKNSSDESIALECKNLNLWYDKFHALININVAMKKNNVTAIIGRDFDTLP